MLAVLIAIASVLIGASLGLQARRLRENATASVAGTFFPHLSVAAALITGLALTEWLIVVAVLQWPSLATFITGPLPTFWGFTWFCEFLAFCRHSTGPQSQEGISAPALSVAPGIPTLPLPQIGLGALMGLLLCAVGARDLGSMGLALICALLAATATVPPTLRYYASQIWPEVVRGLTGALLCAVGVGTSTERMTEHAVPALAVTIVLTSAFWTLAASAFRRALRQTHREG